MRRGRRTESRASREARCLFTETVLDRGECFDLVSLDFRGDERFAASTGDPANADISVETHYGLEDTIYLGTSRKARTRIFRSNKRFPNRTTPTTEGAGAPSEGAAA